MLYLALINLGDQLVNDDLLAAYEQYSQACNLPVPDTVTACAKASNIIPLLTPTPTPTLTPTPGADTATGAAGHRHRRRPRPARWRCSAAGLSSSPKPGAARVLCGESRRLEPGVPGPFEYYDTTCLMLA